jgi:hypothetical protein
MTRGLICQIPVAMSFRDPQEVNRVYFRLRHQYQK